MIDTEQRIRDLEDEIRKLKNTEVDLAGRRMTNAGNSVQSRDYVTRAEVDRFISAIDIPKIDNKFKVINVQTRTGFPKITIDALNGIQIFDSVGTLITNIVGSNLIISSIAASLVSTTELITVTLAMAGLFQNFAGTTTAANDMTFTTIGNYMVVSGNTTINGLFTTNPSTADPIQIGTHIYLHFASNPTVKHNTAPSSGYAKFLLQGSVDLVAAADTILEVILTSTGWQEVSRKTA